MNKKIALLVLITFLFSIVCLYAAPKSASGLSAGDANAMLRARIESLEKQIKKLEANKQKQSDEYQLLQATIKDLKKVLAQTEKVCQIDESTILSLKDARNIDELCSIADDLSPYL